MNRHQRIQLALAKLAAIAWRWSKKAWIGIPGEGGTREVVDADDEALGVDVEEPANVV